ncbi:MAG TPA: insulinase family protein [Gammaproteobacteria bacterium]|nr:insulinase family protein [Gammaproteobacteria bacterium]
MRNIIIWVLFVLLFQNIQAIDPFKDAYRFGVNYSNQTLNNGLNVVLAHDPLSTSSKVILVVESGSSLDGKLLGQAHLLEHMLFQGSKKYPETKSFQKFVSQSGGYTNAFTEPDYTLYYMVMNQAVLQEGLDRLGSIIQHPKLDPAAIDEEKKSVHEEYLLSKNQDGFIMRDLMAKQLYGDSAHGMFFAGSIDTLKKVNHKTIRDFFNQHYRPDKMTLLVNSSQSIDQMQQWVREYFEPIKSSSPSPIIVPKSKPNDKKGWDMVKVRSNQNTNSMMVTFPLPGLWGFYEKSSVIDFLIYRLSYAGNGGLEKFLKDKGWVNGLGFFTREMPEYGSMNVSLDLTDQGKHHVEDILGALEEYLHYLTLNTPENYVYNTFRQAQEHKKISVTGSLSMGELKFMARMAKHGDIESLVTPMPKKLDEKAYHQLLSFLSPERARVLVFDSDFKGQKPLKYYDTDFSQEWALSKNMKASFSRIKKNPYVMSAKNPPAKQACYSLSEVAKDMLGAMPVLNVSNQERVCVDHLAASKEAEILQKMALWESKKLVFPYGEINVYSGPVKGKTDAIIKLLIRKNLSSDKDSVLSMMLLQWVRLKLIPELFEPIDAGYSLNFNSEQMGIKVSVRGPSTNLIRVTRTLLEKLNSPLTESEFKWLIEYTVNEQVADRKQTGRYYLPRLVQELLFPFALTPTKRISILHQITKEQFNEYIRSLVDESYVSGVAFMDEAMDSVQQDFSLLFKRQHQRIKEIASECYYFPDKNQFFTSIFSSTKESGFLNLTFPVVSPPTNHHVPALHYSLLSQLIGVDFYNELRTQKQLGYMAHYADTNSLMFFPRSYALVVSSRYDGLKIEKEVNSFLSTIIPRIKSIKEGEFKKVKRALLANYTSMPSLDLQAEIEFNRSFVEGYVAFDKRYRYLKHLGYQEWVASLVQSYEGAGALNVVVDSSIRAKEIDSIQKYHKHSKKHCIRFH